jgi:hypothetical protein
MRTVSPIRTSLRSTSSWLCSGGTAHRHARDVHRLELGHRGQLPGAADLYDDVHDVRDFFARRTEI